MVVTISLALLESGNCRFGRPGFDYNSLRVRACVCVVGCGDRPWREPQSKIRNGTELTDIFGRISRNTEKLKLKKKNPIGIQREVLEGFSCSG